MTTLPLDAYRCSVCQRVEDCPGEWEHQVYLECAQCGKREEEGAAKDTWGSLYIPGSSGLALVCGPLCGADRIYDRWLSLLAKLEGDT